MNVLILDAETVVTRVSGYLRMNQLLHSSMKLNDIIDIICKYYASVAEYPILGPIVQSIDLVVDDTNENQKIKDIDILNNQFFVAVQLHNLLSIIQIHALS